MIFRPHPAGPPNPKPAGKRDTPQVKAREVQAINVLSRAAHDLRRFHAAASGLERKRFLEARHWINANDNFREFSFVNVCPALGADPDRLRRELLADISLIWLGYSGELSGRLSLLLQDSLARRFASSRSTRPNHISTSKWQRSGAMAPQSEPNRKTRHMSKKMKIIVIGGNGRIGTRVVNNLRQRCSSSVPSRI